MRAVERASGISTLAKIRKDVSVEKDRRGADGDRSVPGETRQFIGAGMAFAGMDVALRPCGTDGIWPVFFMRFDLYDVDYWGSGGDPVPRPAGSPG